MAEIVEYLLKLKDEFSSPIEHANESVNKLEHSLGLAKELLAGIGIGLASFKLVEYLESSNEAWEKMEFAMSQVEAGLKSTGGVAGLTFEELKSDAESTAHSVKFAQSEILGLQSLLLTFPSITKDTFKTAETAIIDMSTRMGQDLKSSAIQVGKALQDPERGITALRRVGVNFNEEQTKVIKNLVETGKQAQAQAMILKELSVEFGGSAAAAAEADKSFRLDKTMEETRVETGKFIDELKEDLLPTLESLASAIRKATEFLHNHWKEIKVVVAALGTAWLAYKTLSGASAILLAIENAAMKAAMSTTEFSLALDITPLGAFALALGSIAAAYVAISNAAEEAKRKKEEYLGNVKNDEEDFINQRMADSKIKNKNAAFAQAVKDEQAELTARLQSTQKALESEIELRDRLQQKRKDSEKTGIGLSEEEIQQLKAAKENIDSYFPKEMEILNARQTGLDALKKSGYKKPATTTVKVDADDTVKSKAKGTKAITINVDIRELIGIKEFRTTNIKEGIDKLREAVVGVMTGAVNDFQVVAEKQ